MTTEYKNAFDNLNYADSNNLRIDDLGEKSKATIRRALKVMIALTGEPSETMTKAAIESYNQNGQFALVTHFKAMRDQLLKEVDND